MLASTRSAVPLLLSFASAATSGRPLVTLFATSSGRARHHRSITADASISAILASALGSTKLLGYIGNLLLGPARQALQASSTALAIWGDLVDRAFQASRACGGIAMPIEARAVRHLHERARNRAPRRGKKRRAAGRNNSVPGEGS
jgi:hypothetical protein